MYTRAYPVIATRSETGFVALNCYFQPFEDDKIVKLSTRPRGRESSYNVGHVTKALKGIMLGVDPNANPKMVLAKLLQAPSWIANYVRNIKTYKRNARGKVILQQQIDEGLTLSDPDTILHNDSLDRMPVGATLNHVMDILSSKIHAEETWEMIRSDDSKRYAAKEFRFLCYVNSVLRTQTSPPIITTCPDTNASHYTGA